VSYLFYVTQTCVLPTLPLICILAIISLFYFVDLSKCVPFLLSGPAEEEGRLWQSNRCPNSFPAFSFSQIPLSSQSSACTAPSWWEREWVRPDLQGRFFIFGNKNVCSCINSAVCLFVSSSCSEEDSPQWLKELKSKKRLSQYDNDS